MDRLTAMETFVRVVESGSFSEAARQLHVGQPAVSKTIAQLEDALGVKLLFRSTRGLVPTEAGLSFYKGAKRSIEEVDDAFVAARGAGVGLSGRLRVGAATTFASLHLVPYLGDFLTAHPNVDLELALDDERVDLIEEGIDIALRMGDLADSSLTARRIGQGRRIVVGTPGYFAKAGAPKIPADLLMHEAIIHARASGGDVWRFCKDGAEVSVTVRGRLRISAAQGIRTAVLADMGLAVASEWMFAPELANGEVREVLCDWVMKPIDVWAVFPTGRVASAKARAFADFVEALMASQADCKTLVRAG